ncbi:hypothetical protein RIF29_22433 [Crotalaria pallida]|uniref:Ribosomal protein S25 n=1 Tax=Crotalaria pallida TaxID=3830 RepID=A0AAN9F4Z2_CROPI
MGSTSATPLEQRWKKIWTTQEALPRVKETVWRACKHTLPVRVALRRRGVQVDPTCPCCDQEEETVSHAILSCPRAQQVWFASPLGLRTSMSNNHGLEEWLTHIIQTTDKKFTAKVFNLIWAVWNRRNQRVFNNRWLEIEEVLHRASWVEVPSTGPSPHKDRVEHWNPPHRFQHVAYAKVNIYASVKQSVGTGLGLVVRDNEGAILAASSHFMEETLELSLADAVALKWAIKKSVELGLTAARFETNCLELQEAWGQKHHYSTCFEEIVKECKQEAGRQRKTRLLHRLLNPPTGGGKQKKKKWSKGKQKEKVNNMVLFDQASYDKLLSEAPKYKLITPSVLSDRLTINGSLARKAIKDLMARGSIRMISSHASQQIYTRATNTN